MSYLRQLSCSLTTLVAQQCALKRVLPQCNCHAGLDVGIGGWAGQGHLHLQQGRAAAGARLHPGAAAAPAGAAALATVAAAALGCCRIQGWNLPGVRGLL
eukprot:980010-Pelagomonas_calceolata.AAC.5